MSLVDDSRRTHAVTERYVFCVDDDAEFLKSLEVLLPEQINASAPSGLWYRFLFYSDPQQAIQTLEELTAEGETIAMVISDQKMPNIKGTELLAKARQISSPSVRVLLTGYAGIESAIQAINERLLDKYLTKPIEDDRGFAVSIQHLLQGFEMQRTIKEQSEIIGDLYEFANRLNAMEGMDATLRSIAEFTQRTLHCRQVFVLARDAVQGLRSSTLGMAGEVAQWLCPPTAPKGTDDPSLLPQIRIVQSPAELLGQVFDVDEAIRQAPRFPLLLSTLSANGEVLGMIGAADPEAPARLGEEAHRTLSYISSTASIALRKVQGHDRLQAAYSTIQADALKLGEANRRLRLLDEIRSEFLGFIAHELATPLSMMSAVEMLDDSSSGSDRTSLLEAAQHGYERLNALVKQALMYFSWLSRAPEWSSEITDVAAILASALSGEPEYPSDRIELLRPKEPCRARIPASAAATIAKTLLDNAVGFSEKPSKIRVVLERTADEVVLSVSDGGRGFPADWGSELFRPFTVPDTLHHKRGSGLSLATAAAIVQSFHGRIEARSPGLGQGATFVVHLPSDCNPGPLTDSAVPELIGERSPVADPSPPTP